MLRKGRFLWYNRLMIILFGLAGTGKSTHGKLIAEHYGMTWLSVGQVLRDTGEFDEILKKGELVDDDTVIALMNAKIKAIRATGQEIVLDGFPRDEYQAKWVGEHLANDIQKAIVLEVPKEVLWQRIEERGREDDTREAIERRFKIVEQNIYAILEILKSKGVEILHVSSEGTIEEAQARIEQAIFGEETETKLPKFLK